MKRLIPLVWFLLLSFFLGASDRVEAGLGVGLGYGLIGVASFDGEIGSQAFYGCPGLDLTASLLLWDRAEFRAGLFAGLPAQGYYYRNGEYQYEIDTGYFDQYRHHLKFSAGIAYKYDASLFALSAGPYLGWGSLALAAKGEDGADLYLYTREAGGSLRGELKAPSMAFYGEVRIGAALEEIIIIHSDFYSALTLAFAAGWEVKF